VEYLALLAIELRAPIRVEAYLAYATELYRALLQHFFYHIEFLLPARVVVHGCGVETRHSVAAVGVLLGEGNHSVTALRVDVGEDKSLYASLPGALKSLFAVGVKLLGVYM
jgi:hypothetical protein